MPALIRKTKVTCDNCGTQTTRNNIARHNKRCSAGSLICPSCIIFSTETPAEMIHNIAKKHSKTTPSVVHMCKKCNKDVHGFYNLREHKQKEHGAHTCSVFQKTDVAHVMGDKGLMAKA